MTHPLKEQIIGKLESLSENVLIQVLDFVEFLEWRKTTATQSEVAEPEQIEASCTVEYLEGVLVVKAAAQNHGDFESVAHNLREERISKFTNS